MKSLQKQISESLNESKTRVPKFITKALNKDDIKYIFDVQPDWEIGLDYGIYPAIPELVEAGKKDTVAQGKYWFMHPALYNDDVEEADMTALYSDVVPYDYIGAKYTYDSCLEGWNKLSTRNKKRLINFLKNYNPDTYNQFGS